MTDKQLEELKKDIYLLKVKTIEKNKARNIKNRETIESIIQYQTQRIIDNYQLLKYHLGIKEESHKTKFFIQDVEDIIQKIENENTNDD
jgi:hypothetical protein